MDSLIKKDTKRIETVDAQFDVAGSRIGEVRDVIQKLGQRKSHYCFSLKYLDYKWNGVFNIGDQMKMKERKRFVGNKTQGPISTALEALHRKIRIISTLFVYHLPTVVAEEPGTSRGAAYRTAI